MANPQTHTCHDCGYVWPHGRHGGHDCTVFLKQRVKQLETVLTEARTWIGDGDNSESIGLPRCFWSPEYIAIVDKVDSVLSTVTKKLSRKCPHGKLNT